MEHSLGRFGDRRLEKGGSAFCHGLWRSGVSVRGVGGSRAGEIRFTRFLRNRRVTPEEMVATARARTAGLVRGRHILAIQDTTTLRDDGKLNSLNLHPMIAVDAEDGALLGLVDAVFLSRSGGKKRLSAKRPFADKESRRWLDATQTAAGLAMAGAASVTVIADQEGDIYEEFACRPIETELLVRAHHDRVLAGGGTLYGAMAEVAELGRETIELTANPGRPARKVVLALRAGEVTLKRPKRNHPGEAAEDGHAHAGGGARDRSAWRCRAGPLAAADDARGDDDG